MVKAGCDMVFSQHFTATVTSQMPTLLKYAAWKSYPDDNTATTTIQAGCDTYIITQNAQQPLEPRSSSISFLCYCSWR